MKPLDKKTKDALRWMTDIFDKHNIPYRIGGGFAAKLYGSPRPLNDLDFGIPDEYFPAVIPLIEKYATWGPARWNKDGKWDCELITLNYNGQEIDISGSTTIKISNKDRAKWLPVVDAHPLVPIEVEGIKIKVMHPTDLMNYKKELDGNHQLVDIRAIESYLANNKNQN